MSRLTIDDINGIIYYGTSKSEIMVNNNPCGEIAKEQKNSKKELTDNCPQCGERGEFIRMALCCSTHGAFGGC